MKLQKLILCFTMVLATLTFAPQDTRAQSEGSILFVAPHRVDIGPEERVSVLNVANKSNIKRRYYIQMIDQVMDENGSTRRVEDDFEYSAQKMLRFTPKRFTLDPGQRQIVRIQVRRPKDLGDGDYHSHLLFREVPLKTEDRSGVQASAGKASFEIKALYGVAVPVVLKNGDVNSTMSINSVGIQKNEQGLPVLALQLQRTGNAEASALLKVVHRKNGQDTDIITPQWMRMYREVENVSRVLPLSVEDGYALSGGSLIATLTQNPDKKIAEVIDSTEVSLP